MKSKYFKPMALGMTLAFVIGASFTAFADNQCQVAYGYCMPIYNECVNSGAPQSDCHLQLDACILRNGCSWLP
jgi:hypothetical protein